jgi:thiamine biosynthesis lipoprotein
VLVHLSRKAMAGEFEICLPISQAGEATAAALRALDLVQALERQLSYFKPESELSQINRTAAEREVEVEPRLFALLELAMQVWRDSGGAYDLTATPLWEAWGFARRAGAVPSPEQLAAARAQVGAEWVEMDPRKSTVRFHRPGLRLNLGSIGKGYAVDRAVESLLAEGVTDFLVHGGYSSVAARGFVGPSCREGPTPPEPENATSCNDAAPTSPFQQKGPTAPWTIGVKDPLRDDVRVGQIELRDRALGTSGSQHQSFRHRGRRYGHILDPRSGQPAEGVLAVSVVAPTAAEADALSTAFYVLGPQWALDYCRRHPAIAMVMFCPAEGNRWEVHDSGVGIADCTLPPRQDKMEG